MEKYKEDIRDKIEKKITNLRRKNKLISTLNNLKTKNDIKLWSVRNNLNLNHQQTLSKKQITQPKKQTTPITQQKKTTPITQQKKKTPITQQKKKTPITQQKKTTPITQQKKTTPITQQKKQTKSQKNMRAKLSQQQYLQYLEEEYKNVGLEKKNFNYFHVPMDNLCGFHSIALYFNLSNEKISKDHTSNILELRNRLIAEYQNELSIDSSIEKSDIRNRINLLSNDIKEWLSDEDFAMLSKIYDICFYVYREDQKLWQIYSYEIPQMNSFEESNRECDKLINQNTSSARPRTRIYLRATGIHYDLLLDKNINIKNINLDKSSSLSKINGGNSEWRNEYEFMTRVNIPGFYDNDFDDESSSYSDFFNSSFPQLRDKQSSQKKSQKKKSKTNSATNSLTSYNYSDLDQSDIFDSDDEEYNILDNLNMNVIRQVPNQRRKVPVRTEQELRKIIQKCFTK